MRLLLVLGLVFCSQASGQNVIATIAGNGVAEFSGDGGPATSASLNNPTSVAVDASGNLFIADEFNHRVRKIFPNGIIITVAGNGIPGFSGDGGQATSASLSYPYSVALDASGNLFIADLNNQRIRKVTSNGVITTVAGNGFPTFSGDGGPAVAASLNYPYSIATDNSGNLYIADSHNCRIRKVAPNGIITTVAGDGACRFSGDNGPASMASLNTPQTVLADGAGNLFIADTNSYRVRKVSPGGVITTVAGNGILGPSPSADGGPATSTSLLPTGIALDTAGILYIGDFPRIRKVSATGIVSTVAGNGSYGFTGDLGPATAATLNVASSIAIDAAGNLFFADTFNHRIREVSATVPALAATLSINPASFSNLTFSQGAKQFRQLQIGGVAGAVWQATVATSSGGAWLSVSPFSGQTPASVSALIDTAALMPGSYQGSITISVPGAVPPSLTVKISITVLPEPAVTYSITNAASSFSSGLNGIAQGSMFVVYGSRLGPASLQQSNSFPIPLTLAGTSVQITMSGATYNAPVIYTSASQVAAILPSSVPTGDGSLVVTYNGNATRSTAIHVVKSAFGVFSVSSDGAGPGVIQDAANRQLSFSQPAHPGDIVTLWGTGLGPVSGEEAAKPLPGNSFRAEVFVGNRAAIVQYAGRSGCCAALDEIAFQIPTGVQGCFVPLVVRSNNVVSNFVTLPIAPAGQACSDPIGPSPDLLTKSASGLKYGAIAIGSIPALDNFGAAFIEGVAERLSSMLGTRVATEDLQTIIRSSHARRSRALQAVMKKYAPMLRARHIDPSVILGMTNILNYQGVTARFQPATSNDVFSWQFAGALPPPGTCIAGVGSSYGSGDFRIGRNKDAGAQLFFTGPAGTQTLDRRLDGTYQLALGPGTANFGLPGGTYVVASSGGNDVGPFTATLDVGPALTWTNKASVGFIDRSAPLTIDWSGGPSTGYVVFGGQAGQLSAGFTCVADVRDRTLTVPDYVLSLMPHTPDGVVFLVDHPLQNLFTATGIDIGFFANLNMDSKPIAFQ